MDVYNVFICALIGSWQGKSDSLSLSISLSRLQSIHLVSFLRVVGM